jgi:hypothetical protein
MNIKTLHKNPWEEIYFKIIAPLLLKTLILLKIYC